MEKLHTQKNIEVKGNIWSVVFGPNYVSVRKETNNPFKGPGKEFPSIHEAIDNYKSIAMKAALMQLIEVPKKVQVKKFEVGNIYTMSFIGDSDLKVKYICIKITPKTVSFEKFKAKYPEDTRITRKININDGVEYIRTGDYSMAPTIAANRIVG